MTDPRGRPDHVDAAWTMLLALLAVAAIWGLSLVARGVPPEGYSLLLQAVFLAVPLLYARAVGLRPLEAAGFRPLGWRAIAMILVASLSTMWLLQGLWLFEFEIFRGLGMEEEVAREIEGLNRAIGEVEKRGSLIAVLLLAVVPPLCEETLFRGLVLRGFARRFGWIFAIGATTVMFALMHQSRAQGAMMLVLGFYFGSLVWLTGSLWAGVIAHAANNFAVVLITGKYGEEAMRLRAPWWMYVLSAVVFAGAMLLLAMDRREKPLTSP